MGVRSTGFEDLGNWGRGFAGSGFWRMAVRDVGGDEDENIVNVLLSCGLVSGVIRGQRLRGSYQT